MHIYSLGWMIQLPDGVWTAQAVGIYSSIGKAEDAIKRLRVKEPFCNYPKGFYIHCVKVDADYEDGEFQPVTPSC
jgi:hypothetical protein